MNFQQALALLALIGTFTATTGHIGGMVPAQHEKPRTYCGRVLATALALLCYEDDQPTQKRSGTNTMYNHILPGYYEEPQMQVQDSDYGWPWMSALKARTLSTGARNKRQFVVSECCDKACTIKELMSYC